MLRLVARSLREQIKSGPKNKATNKQNKSLKVDVIYYFSMGYLLYSLPERVRSCSGEKKKKKKTFRISSKFLVCIVFFFLFYEHHPSSVLITGLMISSWVFYGAQDCGITTWQILMNLSFMSVRKGVFLELKHQEIH